MPWLIPMDLSIFFICIQIIRSQFPSYKNYAVMLTGVWVFIIMISRFGLYDTFIPSQITYIIMYIALAVFVGTTYVLQSYEHLRARRAAHLSGKASSRTPLNLNDVNYVPLVLIAGAITVVLLPFLPDALRILQTGGFSSVRHNVLYAETSTYSSSSLVFLKWVVNPLILAEFSIAVAALVFKRFGRRKLYVVILLVITCANLIMYTLVFAGRWLMMEALMMLGVLVIIEYGMSIWKIITKNFMLFLLGLAAFIAAIVISNDRSIGNTDFFTSVYVYFAGPVDMLNILLENPDMSRLDQVMFGAYTVEGLLSPLYVVVNRVLHTNIPLAISQINAVTSTMVNIAPNMHMNNNCTFVYGVLRDFGAAGILIGPTILAVACQKVYSYYAKFRSDYSIMLYSYMSVILFFMIIEWMFGRVNVVYTGIFLYGLMRVGIACHRMTKPLGFNLRVERAVEH